MIRDINGNEVYTVVGKIESLEELYQASLSFIEGKPVAEIISAPINSNGKPQYEATSEEISLPALMDLLNPLGKSKNIGEEKGKNIENGITNFISPYGSIRYVAFEKSKIVSAIQLISSDGLNAKLINAITTPEKQKQGLASALIERAREDFNTISFSEDLTTAGSALANNTLNKPIKYDKKIIGFAKYRPFLNTDHRFRQQLCTGCWYPIVAVKNELIKLQGFNNAHYGLFENIVAIDKHKNKFAHLVTENNKDIQEYWDRKNKEKNDKQQFLLKLQKEISEEKEKIKLAEEKVKDFFNGNIPKRKQVIFDYLQNKNYDISIILKRSHSDPVFKQEVLDDIKARMIKSEELFQFKFKHHENYYERTLNKLKKLKDSIENYKPEIIEVEKKSIISKIRSKFKR